MPLTLARLMVTHLHAPTCLPALQKGEYEGVDVVLRPAVHGWLLLRAGAAQRRGTLSRASVQQVHKLMSNAKLSSVDMLMEFQVGAEGAGGFDQVNFPEIHGTSPAQHGYTHGMPGG